MDAVETMPIAVQVERALQQIYPQSQISVDQAYGAEKVSGYVVWNGFEGQSIEDRQTAIYRNLRDALGEQARFISLIFTYTPHEFALMNSI